MEPFLEQVHPEEFEGDFFQQDGATAHTTQDNLGFLEEFCPGRVMSRGQPSLQILLHWTSQFLDFLKIGSTKNKLIICKN